MFLSHSNFMTMFSEKKLCSSILIAPNHTTYLSNEEVSSNKKNICNHMFQFFTLLLYSKILPSSKPSSFSFMYYAFFGPCCIFSAYIRFLSLFFMQPVDGE